MELKESIRPPCRRGTACRAPTGSVLVLTLWVIVFLALLAMAVASHVAAHLQVASDLKWGLRMRDIGIHALVEVVAVLKEDETTTYDTLQESWAGNDGRFKKVPYEEGSFSIVSGRNDSLTGSVDEHYGLTDEEGKVSINGAPSQVLSRLFQTAGMTSVQADELARFIVDWRDENSVPDGGSFGSEACDTLSVPYHCKNADFEVMEELWWMPGMTTGLYEAIRDEVTLFGAGAVNINTAGSLALRSLGLTENGAERIIQWRSQSGHFFDSASSVIAHAAETGISEADRLKLGSAVAVGWVGVGSNLFRGAVEADFAGRSRRVAEFIVDRDGKIIWWRE